MAEAALSQVDAVATEAELLDLFVGAVRALDPDILVGYDAQKVHPVTTRPRPVYELAGAD